MNDEKLEERWGVWMVQAQNFERRENYAEAVSRAGLVVRSIEQALEVQTDPGKKDGYRHLLLRARRQEETLQSKLDAWTAAIAARRAHVIASAAEEMARPLPVPPPPRRG